MSRFFSFVLLGSALLAAPGAAHAESFTFTMTGHLPTLDVTVNGERLRFAVDTAASGIVVLDAAAAARLGLAPSGSVKGSDGSEATMTLPTYRVASVEAAGMRFTDLEVTGMDLRGLAHNAPLDGLLGIAAFAGRTLSIDYASLSLSVTDEALPARGDGVMAFETVKGLPSVAFTCGGAAFSAFLDTGSGGGLMLPKAEFDRLPLQGEPRTVGHARTAAQMVPVRAGSLAEPCLLAGMPVGREVYSADVFTRANIGSRVLREFVVTLDLKNSRVRLSPSRAPR